MYFIMSNLFDFKSCNISEYCIYFQFGKRVYKKYNISVHIMCLANFHGINKHIDNTGRIKIFDNVFCNYGRERM